MDRRQLIQSLVALPLIPVKDGAKAVELKTGNYLIFVNPASVDMDEFCRGWPAGVDGKIIPIHPNDDIDEVVRIYRLDE